MNGKNKELLRSKYENETGKKPITSKGAKSSAYQTWLKKSCTPHWMSTATELFKYEPELEAGTITFTEAKKNARETTQLAEKCIITPASRIQSKLKEFEKRFSI